MGYAVYEDHPAQALGVERWAGYGVPAVCDVEDCGVEINRGMGYRCEEWVSCIYDPETEEEVELEMEGCDLSFCIDHQGHPRHGDNVTPKPDTPAWQGFMLLHDSWANWRTENPEKVEIMRLTADLDAARILIEED